MTYRSGYRAAAIAALKSAPLTRGATVLSAWAGSIDVETLPVMGVVTPQERSTPSTHGSFERVTMMQVVLKRTGGDDLEDVLDADAAEIEPVIMMAVGSGDVQCLLEDLSIVVNAEGGQKIGTLIQTFRVTSWRSLGP